MALLAPSILSADFANLQRDVEMLNRSEADLIHVDIMDGRFVPNISFGLPVCEAIARHAEKPLDVHLMIVEPEKYLKQFKDAGADRLSIHIEASPNLHRSIQTIKELDLAAGVAVNPHTTIESLIDILPEIDTVLLMSVNPGFGGQKFIENTFSKVERLARLRETMGLNFTIGIDGGVSTENATRLVETGANILIAGSFVFQSEDPLKTIGDLKKAIT
ncbi:MAG: ribulose-phosphate 3-epimerase [Spirosomataceae bacterium]|jgi:ribulose-phosphate 3-epimerase